MNHTVPYLAALINARTQNNSQSKIRTSPAYNERTTSFDHGRSVKNAQYNQSLSMKQPVNNRQNSTDNQPDKKRVNNFHLSVPDNRNQSRQQSENKDSLKTVTLASRPVFKSVNNSRIETHKSKPGQKSKTLLVKAFPVQHQVNKSKVAELQKRLQKREPRSGSSSGKSGKSRPKNPKFRPEKGSGQKKPRVHDVLLTKDIHVRAKRQAGNVTTSPSRDLQETSTTHNMPAGTPHEVTDEASSTSAVATPENGQLPATGIRFANGSGKVAGYVEVRNNNQWGLVCADNADDRVASVVCKSLGYPAENAVVIYDKSPLASPGSNLTAVMANPDCSGNEEQIQECPHNTPDRQGCEQENYLAVRCQVVRNEHLCEEREHWIASIAPGLWFNGTWVTIHRDGINNQTARVICHELGQFAAGATVVNHKCPVPEAEAVVQGDFRCFGNEESLLDCQNKLEIYPGNYNHTNILVVSCFYNPHLRIKECETPEPDLDRGHGVIFRPEVEVRGEWGTICGEQLTDNDARVICYELGYPRDNARAVKADNLPGCSDNLQPLINQLLCNGNETNYKACYPQKIGQYNCDKSKTLLVNCSPVIRIATECGDASTADSGVLQLWKNPYWWAFAINYWAFVSDENFDQDDVSVACRELGLSGFGATSTMKKDLDCPSGRASRVLVGLYDINCAGNETSLKECPIRNVPEFKNYAIVHCKRLSLSICKTAGSPSDVIAGTLEVNDHGRWKTVCGIGFNNHAASIACEEMGFARNGTIIKNKECSTGSSLLQLTQFDCSGTETKLLECQQIEPMDHRCQPDKDSVVLQCQRYSPATQATAQATTQAITTIPTASTKLTAVTSQKISTPSGATPNHEKGDFADSPSIIPVVIGSVIGAGVVLACAPCCYLNGNKLKQDGDDSSPCEHITKTISTTLRDPWYFKRGHQPLIEEYADDTAPGEDTEQPSTATTAV